jgi:serine/threonine protein kinase
VKLLRKPFRFRPRLLTRVALALAAVGLLPLAISSLGLVDLNRDALEEQVLHTHTVAAQTGADRVGNFLAVRLALARGAASSVALGDPRSAEARQLLSDSLRSWADMGVQALAVVDAHGAEVIRAQLAGDPARIARALAPPPGRQVLVVAGAPLLVRIEVPLALSDGYLRMICDGAPLADAVRPEGIGDEADLVLADRAGHLVAGSAALASFPPEQVRVALSGKVAGAGRYQDPAEGPVLGAYAPVPWSRDWVVLSRQPSRVAESVSYRVRNRSLAAIGAALLLIALLSAVAWISLIRPIRELAQAQRRLAGARLGTDRSDGGDEIGDLRASFESLERSLTDRGDLDAVFLGRYQVVALLGSGAMGTVFRGWDPKLQRPVALKTVRMASRTDSPGSDPEGRKRLVDTLLREAITVARLNHPNVVAVYDVEDSPAGAFVAMELVDGMDLDSVLDRRGRLSPGQVTLIGAAVARGLAAAHARGIVHRDVKPANVLLGRDGSIKVSDFGIAGLLAAAEAESDRIFGTPGYIAPEVLQGEGVRKSSDLFALGVVLYQCLRGVHPFSGRHVDDIVRATLFDPAPPLARAVPDLPPELDAMVQLLLHRDPAYRPSDAMAVAVELERLVRERHFHWDPALVADGTAPAEPPVSPGHPALHAQWLPTTRLTGSRTPRSTSPVGTAPVG